MSRACSWHELSLSHEVNITTHSTKDTPDRSIFPNSYLATSFRRTPCLALPPAPLKLHWSVMHKPVGGQAQEEISIHYANIKTPPDLFLLLVDMKANSQT